MKRIALTAALAAFSFTVGLALAQVDQQRGVAVGKPAPEWNITDAHNFSKTAKLADYKGKWVVLDFWATWCPPCVGMSIPAWMKFAEDHKDQADMFQIVTVHETHRGVANAEQLGPKLKQLEESRWKNKKFTLPVIFDSTDKTAAAYGINAYPTAVLIDPEGKVVKVELGYNGVIDHMLAEKLDEAKKAKAGKEGVKPEASDKPAAKPEAEVGKPQGDGKETPPANKPADPK